MAYAWDGVRAFEQDGATHDFRTLGGLYAETVQLFTMDPDIKTVEDLRPVLTAGSLWNHL